MGNGDLAELYRIRFAEDQLPRKNAIWQVICEDFLQRFVAESDTVVDVACGYGEFLNNISAGQKIAVDLNADELRFLDSDIEFHQLAATELSSVVTGAADVVFTSNYLEHLPDKKTLDEFLTQVIMALKPGGRYVILGPNLRYLAGQHWDFYDHHLGLTHLSLAEARWLRDRNVQRPLPPLHYSRSFADSPQPGEDSSEGATYLAGARKTVPDRRTETPCSDLVVRPTRLGGD